MLGDASTDCDPLWKLSNKDAEPARSFSIGSEGWADRTFEGGTAGLFGCLALIALPIVAIAVLLSQCSSSTPQPKISTPEVVPTKTGEPNEVDTVTVCDLTLKQFLVSQSSYDAAGTWQYSSSGRLGEVLRRYEATNGFGAKLSAAYDCKYDAALDRVTFLQTVDANGVHTLIGTASSKSKKHHRR